MDARAHSAWCCALGLITSHALAEKPKDPCAHDKAALLALSPQHFDETPGEGWRPLGDKSECRLVAADLIAAYRTKHWGRLAADELKGLLWHEGQMRAAGGDNSRAVPLLMAGVPIDGDDADMADYALGTVAFLQRDLAALKAARDRLAKVPMPASFAKERDQMLAKFGSAPTWPVNLDVLDGLIACWDKPYAVAYQSECRPKGNP